MKGGSMAKDPGPDKSAEKPTQEEATPTSEQKTSEPAKEPEAKPKASVEGEDTKLPEGVKERTAERFQKLQEQLKRERELRIQLEKAAQPGKQPTAEPQVPDDWYDPVTGSVDVDKLRQREKTYTQKISQLEQQVQGVQNQTIAQQEKEAFASYPELDPSGKNFDEDFHDAVQGHLTSQLFKGKSVTFKEAADKISKFANKHASKAEKEGAKKALEQLSPKEQAALEATGGRSDRRLPESDLAQLQQESRQGGDRGIRAVMERMKRIPSVGK
jgi:hypothetical protein